MCGIAGIVDFNRPNIEESLLRRMLALIRHRGPDSFGIYSGKHVGLAHARLSIIDLSGGDQPIHNEDKSIWVVYNGEVFNYPDIRKELDARGHRFYTKTDTEILVHLYEDMGPDLFKDLNGQFAFAIWDKKKEQMLLGRDRLGVRPLFYYQKDSRLVFGSEIKAIFADSAIPREMDSRTLSDIFTCWSPLGEDTPFKNIRQLLPGHYAIFSRKGMSNRKYWQLSFSNGIHSRRSLGHSTPRPLSHRISDSLEASESSGMAVPSLDDLTAELQDLLTDATRIRLRADVPVGAYLSGGLDSTYITSIVKRYFNNQLCTFSVSFSDERFDEALFQEKAVQALRTNHRMIHIKEKDIGESLPRVVWHTETPILRTAPAPLMRLSKLVRDNDYKVVLTGEGSDEIFGGYDIFKEDKIRRFWARFPDSKMRPKLLQKLYPDVFTQGDNRSRVFLERFFKKGLGQGDSPAHSHMIRWGNTARMKSFFSGELKETNQKENGFVDRFVSALPPEFMTWDPFSRAQYTEISIFMSNYLLCSQGDRMAMAHGIEGRFPFLDHRVIDFASNLPLRYRMNGLKEKFLLRKAAANLIPLELAQRPKRPYRAPISRCFLGECKLNYVDELLSESLVRSYGYFDPNPVNKIIEKGRKQNGFLLSERENMALIGILSTQLLHHQFIENFPAVSIEEPEDVKVFHQES